MADDVADLFNLKRVALAAYRNYRSDHMLVTTVGVSSTVHLASLQIQISQQHQVAGAWDLSACLFPSAAKITAFDTSLQL